jgi:hypothetical protein
MTPKNASGLPSTGFGSSPIAASTWLGASTTSLLDAKVRSPSGNRLSHQQLNPEARMLLYNTDNLDEFTVTAPSGEMIRVTLKRSMSGRITKIGIEAPDSYAIKKPHITFCRKAGQNATRTPKGATR